MRAEHTRQRILLARQQHLDIIAVLDARLLALDRHEGKYFGAACRNGHAGLRYTSSDCCIDCMADKNEKRSTKKRKEVK